MNTAQAIKYFNYWIVNNEEKLVITDQEEAMTILSDKHKRCLKYIATYLKEKKLMNDNIGLHVSNYDHCTFLTHNYHQLENPANFYNSVIKISRLFKKDVVIYIENNIRGGSVVSRPFISNSYSVYKVIFKSLDSLTMERLTIALDIIASGEFDPVDVDFNEKLYKIID